MNRTYRIGIADDDHEDLMALRATLSRAGHEVVIEAMSGDDLLKQCIASTGADVELVITNVRMAGMDGLEAARRLLEHREVPIIVVSGCEDDALIEQASASQAFGYLIKPVREPDLKAAICISVQRYQELKSFQSEASSMRQALEDRKIIERAKGILMREKALDESSAFKCLQRLARQHRQKLVEVARSINLTDQALGG